MRRLNKTAINTIPFSPRDCIEYDILIFKRWINISALLLTSVIADARAIYLALIIRDWSNLHGFFHTFTGATILGLLVIGIIWFSNPPQPSERLIMRFPESRYNENLRDSLSSDAAYELYE